MTSVGIVGTGYWAETIHAPRVATLDGPGVRGIWGRNAAARDRIAQACGLRPFASFDELLAAVDIVDLAVPPDAQVDLALRAARAGKHLLLEKPMARSVAEARRLDEAVTEAGVAALVFLTRLFDAGRSAWLSEQAGLAHVSGRVEWISAALTQGSPYAASAWRLEGGALWDVGPHVVSQLEAVLGAVTRVSVMTHEPAGETRLLLEHVRGAVSVVHMTLHADPAHKTESFEFWGPQGYGRCPDVPLDFPGSFANALATLIKELELGEPRRDAAYSTRANVALTRVLATIEALIVDGRRGVFVAVSEADRP